MQSTEFLRILAEDRNPPPPHDRKILIIHLRKLCTINHCLSARSLAGNWDIGRRVGNWSVMSPPLHLIPPLPPSHRSPFMVHPPAAAQRCSSARISNNHPLGILRGYSSSSPSPAWLCSVSPLSPPPPTKTIIPLQIPIERFLFKWGVREITYFKRMANLYQITFSIPTRRKVRLAGAVHSYWPRLVWLALLAIQICNAEIYKITINLL